jgi:hypothetical protein
MALSSFHGNTTTMHRRMAGHLTGVKGAKADHFLDTDQS